MAATITIHLEKACYRPGQLLRGTFAVEAAGNKLETLELSVLWHTHGRGDEDLGVVHFEEWSEARARSFEATASHSFTTRMPVTPYSYDGVLVKVCWCVRVRARWVGGGETLSEKPFVLGMTFSSGGQS
jgi:hypothetical protein